MNRLLLGCAPPLEDTAEYGIRAASLPATLGKVHPAWSLRRFSWDLVGSALSAMPAFCSIRATATVTVHVTGCWDTVEGAPSAVQQMGFGSGCRGGRYGAGLRHTVDGIN